MPPQEQTRKYLDKANELAAQQQFNAAFAQFEIAIRRQYGHAKAHADFGVALTDAGKYPEAIEQFRKAIEFNPAEPLNVEKLAYAFSRSHRLEEDLADFQKAVEKGDRADLFHTWAQVLSAVWRVDQALDEFKKALTKNPQLDLNIELAAGAFYHSKNIEQQVSSFQEGVDKLKSAQAWNTWGRILFRLQRYAAAATQFERAVSARNDWVEAYTSWGNALIRLGDYEQAIDVLQKGLAKGLVPEESVLAFLLLGEALEQIGEHEKAVSNFETAASKGAFRNYFEPWLRAIRMLADPDDAIKRYREMLDAYDWGTSANDWSPYINFGRYLKERGQLLDSAVYFSKSLVLDAHDKAEPELIEILSDMDDRPLALDAIQQIFDRVSDPYRFVQWAVVLGRLNETDRAVKQISKLGDALRGQPALVHSLFEVVSAFQSPLDGRRVQGEIDRIVTKSGDVQIKLTWAELLSTMLDEHGPALTLFKELLLAGQTSPALVDKFAPALQFSPSQASEIADIEIAVKRQSNPDIYYHWALILIRLDKTKPAIEHLKRVVDLNDKDADAHNELGRLYERCGKYAKACQHFEKTVQLDHTRPDTHKDWGTALLKNGRRQEALERYALAVRTRADIATQADSPVSLYMTPVGIHPSGGELISIADKLPWNDEVVNFFQDVYDQINDAGSYREWGMLLVKIKRPESAIEQFKKAVELKPDALQSYSEWLKAIGLAGASPQRLAEYEQAIVKYRNNSGAYSELATFLYRMKRMDQAVQKYQRALELDPRNSHARAWLGYSLITMNDINRAREEARRLVADDPKAGAAYECLSWCAFVDGDYEEAVKQAELGISIDYFYLYETCARALYKSKREDLALLKFDEAFAAQPEDIELRYNYGALLMEMNRYEEAASQFEKVVQAKPDHVYANHNIAAIAFGKGRYEEAYEKWIHAIKVYRQQGPLLKRAVEQEGVVDSSEAFYHASVVMAIQHNHEEAEAVLKEGLEFDPNNTLILRMLADLHWEKKDELVGVHTDTSRRKSEFHWRGMEYFQRAEKLLQERSKRYPNYYVLVELGDLYLLHEDFDKARPCFEQARAKDDTAYVPYAKLGVIHLRQREPEKAIPLLQEALKLNPDELDVKSGLAEAYLRAEKFDEAETTYRQVLAVAPNHVQSLIGLGELSSALGDKKDIDRYSEAVDHFARALEIAGNEKIRSKYLKKSEEAAVYYQLGYARVQSYENAGLRKDTRLLEHARRDFERCIDRNPSHQKARRAKEKIDNRFKYFSRDWLSQTAGPIGILVMSVLVFAFVQAAFLFLPLINQPSLIVSDRTLQAAAKQVPNAPVESLNQIKNQEFDNRKTLSNKLQDLLPADGGKLAEAVMQNAEQVKRFENVPDLPAGYYALLTFGSLLFMVVGLYLPQILKLRVAGIELEKSGVDQAAAGTTLGISKEGGSDLSSSRRV